MGTRGARKASVSTLKETENISPVFPYVIEILPVEVGRTRNSVETLAIRARVSSTSVSITVWKHGKCFLFLKHFDFYLLMTPLQKFHMNIIQNHV